MRSFNPPWAVSLPAQLAAVRALQDPDYYAARYIETRLLREDLARNLTRLGLEVIPGMANFILAHLPESGPTAAETVQLCRAKNLFLRDASPMGSHMGQHALRLAVKDATTNRRMLGILSEILDQLRVDDPRPTASATQE